MSDTCPQWLRDLANRCLSFDPTERPTAEDIIKTLLPHRDTTAFDLFEVDGEADDVEEPSDALVEEVDGVEEPSDAPSPIEEEEAVGYATRFLRYIAAFGRS
ncbi:hypothetical protein SDRG_11859 [Saprolegnia diclina VS20]|uniref:Protein kinase domain-containing protein n=1 Tax=Saprolegnia diclina (strain VS20) TaxID=1156394 RepID=T0RK13_SAPDV|nr:hypothetical protein SDRG_11859 [Saprolegnia diclina VS20]EQC30282.1 hypothetical protein SDRG_11859 [Saprolegnia diclina VS20]|eukprot:XP_008616135.1 hypothetical protein SDRG_11859 [Saprolegnia diclina VS20]